MEYDSETGEPTDEGTQSEWGRLHGQNLMNSAAPEVVNFEHGWAFYAPVTGSRSSAPAGSEASPAVPSELRQVEEPAGAASSGAAGSSTPADVPPEGPLNSEPLGVSNHSPDGMDVGPSTGTAVGTDDLANNRSTHVALPGASIAPNDSSHERSPNPPPGVDAMDVSQKTDGNAEAQNSNNQATDERRSATPNDGAGETTPVHSFHTVYLV